MSDAQQGPFLPSDVTNKPQASTVSSEYLILSDKSDMLIFVNVNYYALTNENKSTQDCFRYVFGIVEIMRASRFSLSYQSLSVKNS